MPRLEYAVCALPVSIGAVVNPVLVPANRILVAQTV